MMWYAQIYKKRVLQSIPALFLFFTAAIEPGPYLKIQKIFTEDFPYIRAEVSVNDITPFENLDQSSFEVYENDWKIGFFHLKKTEPKENPKNVAILVDSSKSLSQKDFEIQIAAVESFVRSLDERDRVALISFHDTVEVRCGFTSSREQITRCIKSAMRSGQNTVLYDGIRQAANLFAKMPDSRNYIILFTDGREEGSQTSLDDLVDIAKNSGAAIFTVGTGSQKNLAPLARISHVTGGEIYLSANISNLEKIYMLLGEILNSTYTIEYISHSNGSLRDAMNKNSADTTLEIRFQHEGRNDQDIRSYSRPGFSFDSFWRNVVSNESSLLFLWGLSAIILLLLFLIVLTVKKKKPAPQPLYGEPEPIRAGAREPVRVGPRDPDMQPPAPIYEEQWPASEDEPPAAKQPPPAAPSPLSRDELGAYKAYLIEKQGPHTGRKHRIQWHVLTIGHADENSIALDDPTVSYRHAKITLKDGEFFLYDLISENGVYLNGKKILRPKILQDFDEIGIGRTTLLFRKASA